jgi:SAM-dependent methyltransferase
MQSPITKTANVTKLESIPSQRVLEDYKNNLKMDVSRFFVGIDSVDIYQCNDSKFRFYYPFSLSGDGQFYNELIYSKKNYYAVWKWEHEKAAQFIKKGDKILELGCGTGTFLEKMAEKGAICHGLELSSEAIEFCKKKNLQVENELIEAHAEKNLEKYDVVCCFQVLEHVTEIKSFIEHSLKVLKPGGLFIAAVPHNNPYIFRYDKYYTLNLPPHHAGLWDKPAFQNLPKFFSMTTTEIAIEPQHDFKSWFASYFIHKNMEGMARFIQKLPGIFNKIMSACFSSFVEGRNIIAVYSKK